MAQLEDPSRQKNEVEAIEDTAETLQLHNSVVVATKTTPFTIFFSAFIGLSALMCNFDNGYGGIVLLMKPFNKSFGKCQMIPNAAGEAIRQCQLTALQQSLLSLTSLFIGLGSVICAPVGARYGRRHTLQLGCLLIIVGAAGMLGTGGNFTAYMACKCICAVGLGFLFAVTPVYGVECTPPRKRGMLTGLYNIGLGLGNVIAAAVCAGSANIPNDWAWKVPIICQIPFAVIFGLGVLLFPDSPRWLVIKKRDDAARKAFGKFYGLDPSSYEITVQLEEVQAAIEFERQNARDLSWTEIFGRKNRRRTLISASILVGLAITGIQFVAPYAAIFLNYVGVSNPYVINVVIDLCIFAGTLIGPWVIEYGGRRFAILTGYSAMSVCMLIFAAVSTGLGSSSKTAQLTLVVFLCLWAFFFGGFIGSSVWVASAEMHSVRLRSYGQASTTFFYQVFAFGAMFWTPYMINQGYGNMGTNVGYFYCGLTIVMLVLTFVLVPETAQLPLEQIDEYFTSKKPAWKTSTASNRIIAQGEVGPVTGE